MTIEEIKNLSPEELKTILSSRKKSMRDIAGSIGLTHPVVVDVINGKYTGSQATINKVWERILFVLQDKEDLNPLVYNNTETFIKLLNVAIKHKSFNDDETMKFIELKKVLTNHSINNQ